MSKIKISARRQARYFLVQALYQWQFSQDDIEHIKLQFHKEKLMQAADQNYFDEVISAVPVNIDDLEKKIEPFLDRPLPQIDPVERAILRLGSYELVHRLDVPYRVVLNESLDLAKLFGAEGSHKYINGILDKLAHQVRVAELKKPARKV